jgi:hypothetical protein
MRPIRPEEEPKVTPPPSSHTHRFSFHSVALIQTWFCRSDAERRGAVVCVCLVSFLIGRNENKS